MDVAPGQTVQRNFDLTGFDQRPSGPEGPVKLSEFIVSSSREMDGAAIAINTQRFAPNVMNVVAADEFGPMATGNVGEILIVFGAGKLPQVGKSIGEGLRNFKDGMKEGSEGKDKDDKNQLDGQNKS